MPTEVEEITEKDSNLSSVKFRRKGRYLVAFASIIVAACVRATLGEWLGDRGSYLAFWPAVMFSSWYGGLGPGLVTTFVSAIVIEFLWAQLRHSLRTSLADIVVQGAFIVLAVLIAILNEQRLRAIERADLQKRLTNEQNKSLAQEISERKALEQDLLRVNKDLARSNEDLAAFAQMISHDLREPLRTMILYSELLKQRCAAQLTTEGREWLDFIASSGTRLTRMINNLLEYAKAGRVDTPGFKPVSLAGIARIVQGNLSDLILETRATITLSELPTVIGDEIQLSQVLQNLIANSIKYRRKEVAPEICVAADSSPTHWIIHVRDNGIGLESAQSKQIFKPFVRATKQSDGAGIGLAICRRIVERHGGTIWLDSVPDRGTTFFFSIAKDLGQPHNS